MKQSWTISNASSRVHWVVRVSSDIENLLFFIWKYLKIRKYEKSLVIRQCHRGEIYKTSFCTTIYLRRISFAPPIFIKTFSLIYADHYYIRLRYLYSEEKLVWLPSSLEQAIYQIVELIILIDSLISIFPKSYRELLKSFDIVFQSQHILKVRLYTDKPKWYNQTHKLFK